MNTLNTDERGQWTSASNAEADRLCPGRHKACRSVPEGLPTVYTLRGTLIHKWLAGEPIELTPEDKDLAEEIREQADVILREQFPDGCTIRFEERLWMNIGVLKHSGKPDLLAYDDSKIVILDYKTGFGFVLDSDSNMQLRDLAVLAFHKLVGNDPNRRAKLVRVGKIQPRSHGRATLCEYNPNDLVTALHQMTERIEACWNPTAPRIPGPKQCQFCRARPTCPEAKATVTALQRVDDAGGELLDGATIARFLDAGKVAKSIIADNEEKAKALLEKNPDAIPGWKLKPGNKVRKVTDPDTVAARFLEIGEMVNFMKSVEVGIGALKEQVRAATGLKGKALDARVDEMIAGTYVEQQNAPSLTRT